MTTPTLFKFKDHDIRTVKVEDNPWFVAADVCRALGLMPNKINGSFQTHTRRLDRDELGHWSDPTSHKRRMVIIAESGLYKLVMRSDKPEAKDFQNWVTKVVLPAIRKDGGYIHGEEHVVSGAMTEDELVFKAMEVMKRKVDRLSAENAKMEAVISEHLTNMTVGEYREHHHQYWEQSTTSKLSARAKKLCLAQGIAWTKQDRLLPRNGKLIPTSVNVYPVSILDQAAAELGIFADA